jgi:hypothetical protein
MTAEQAALLNKIATRFGITSGAFLPLQVINKF